MEIVEMQAMPSDKDMSEKDADLLKNTGVKKKGEFFRFRRRSEFESRGHLSGSTVVCIIGHSEYMIRHLILL